MTHLARFCQQILSRWIWPLDYASQLYNSAVPHSNSRRFRPGLSPSFHHRYRPATQPWRQPAGFYSNANGSAGLSTKNTDYRSELQQKKNGEKNWIQSKILWFLIFADNFYYFSSFEFNSKHWIFLKLKPSESEIKWRERRKGWILFWMEFF